MNTHCISCGSKHVHRSHHRPEEWLVSLLGGSVRRCHDCNTRLAQIGNVMFRAEYLSRLAGLLAFTGLVAAAATVVLLTILWFRQSQTTGASIETGSRFNA